MNDAAGANPPRSADTLRVASLPATSTVVQASMDCPGRRRTIVPWHGDAVLNELS